MCPPFLVCHREFRYNRDVAISRIVGIAAAPRQVGAPRKDKGEAIAVVGAGLVPALSLCVIATSRCNRDVAISRLVDTASHPHTNLRFYRSLDRVGPLPSEGEGAVEGRRG